MKPQNLLYIMSDEHNPKMLGCYGHDQVKTPNLDKLAARGTRFTAHYTNSPICIPARAAFATGRYTHETKYWDNALPYDGEVKGWGHRLQDEGHRVESIGKLHYRHEDLNTGFSKQHHPMHVMDGVGQVWGSIRDPLPDEHPAKMLKEIGPGESNYNRYDRLIADEACQWLKDAAESPEEKPWVLYLGFVAPHFPLIVPEEFYNMYPLDQLPPRKLDPEKGFVRHPWLQRMDDYLQVDRHLSAEQRLIAVAAYFGLCSFIDAEIGRVLDVLAECGLVGDTRVVYTSDHGDNVGARGMWGKSNMYEESAGIPLIVAGDGIPEGKVSSTTTSLLDSYQTVMDGVGLDLTDGEQELAGGSWFEMAHTSDDPERIVFSEYHATSSPTGGFMLRKGKYKFLYYVDYEPELFDLEADPEETSDLAADPNYAEIVTEYEGYLRAICDPEKVDRQAKDDQNALIEKFGGRDKALHTGTPGATPVPGQGHE
ncbi:MAG: sulfatase-like hydrolase/transferase [Rhodospirillaceae bacterium]|jgi:choline-sulfatase|nr:sulfatase-like hydrolase/transferase [Rhodospirillaceae bacterium]MBT4588839.1 sulfatase-like hydrolase/transferase [Rhodospirillaceae bacterium]MBT4939494.1 sulfatase-like hydrolase/transferase [Rhodospirillaceae bacterium]MBT5940981.1 sulfatase-like hydrolase/transferase [Rhodospirillaceae bacterium]